MSQGANPWSDLGCREAMGLIGRYLVRAVNDAGQVVHLARRREIVVQNAGEFGGVIGQHLDPKPLIDAGRQGPHARQHEIDIAAARRLHGLQLAGELRRRRLIEGHFGYKFGMLCLIGFDRGLRQRQIAGDVDDIDRHGALGHRRGLRLRQRKCGKR